MSSFSNYTNNTNLNTVAVSNKENKELPKNVSKNIFKEALKYLDNSWEKWNNDITKLKQDASTLDRMFNQYNKDTKFLELKQIVENNIEIKKKYLFELEKMVLSIKSNIESSNDI